jgi:hypothetical protein
MDTATITLGLTAIAQLATLATLVVRFYFQDKKEIRQRAWDLEDRLRVAAAQRAVTTGQHQVTVAAIADASTRALGAIGENTDISKDAFHEANGAKAIIREVQVAAVETNLLLAEEIRRRNELQEVSDRRAHDERRGDKGPLEVAIVALPPGTSTP